LKKIANLQVVAGEIEYEVREELPTKSGKWIDRKRVLKEDNNWDYR